MTGRFARVSLLVLVLFGITLLQDTLTPRVTRADDQTIYFPQTGHPISGKFLDYWQKNGGLPVYGYPITDPAMETDPETGKQFLTQWFERNRFELHPENAGTKYEVLLGLLGKDLQRDALQLDPTFQPAQPKAGATFLKETGHNLEGAFLSYWQANGGLERFGYPIGEARMEGSYETGKMLLTQWFERARFEYDPRNQPPYDVQLGLLGVQIKTHPPIKNNDTSVVWQKQGDPGLLYEPALRAVDGQNNFFVINQQATANDTADNVTLYSVFQHSVVQRYSTDGQLTFTLEPPNSYNMVDATADRAGNIYLFLAPPTDSGYSGYKLNSYDSQGHLLHDSILAHINTGVKRVDVDNQGNIYTTDDWTIKKYDPQGNLLTTIVSYTQYQYDTEIISVTIDSQNNLWATITNIENNKPVMQVLHFDSQGKALGQWDVTMPDYTPNNYVEITVDAQSNVFLVGSGKSIVKFSAQGQFQAEWAGADNIKFSDPFKNIHNLGVDNQGNILVSLWSQPFILKLDPQGHYLNRLGSPATDALKCPNSLVQLDNHIFVADRLVDKVIELDNNGHFQSQLAVPEEPINGLITNGQNLYTWTFSSIYRYNSVKQAQEKLNVTIFSATNQVVIDRNEHVYQMQHNTRDGYDQLANHSFSQVEDIAIDQEGTLYTAASLPTSNADALKKLFNTSRIYKFNSDQTDFAAQWGKNGTADEEFEFPRLTFDDQNNLYVLDGYLGRVQKFDRNGKLLAKWSSPDLKDITNFQIDASGNLYGTKDCNVVKIKLS